MKFTALLAELVLYINNQPGYEGAFAEGMDRLTGRDPTSDHIPGSLHELGLAQDIDLYVNGKWQDQCNKHWKAVGEYWESLHEYCAWGGRFKSGDCNHVSFAPPELVGNRR